ncbi:hypothetical protein P3S68_013472 [Capsicum galapagoense]
MGDGVIIGVLDTGFSLLLMHSQKMGISSTRKDDKGLGLGPIPSRRKGHCQCGRKIDRKLRPQGIDRDGAWHAHIKHCWSGGSFAPNASYYGLAYYEIPHYADDVDMRNSIAFASFHALL